MASPDVAGSSGQTGTPDALTALPVAVDLEGASGEAVRRWVEATLGWQPVDASIATLVPPAVRLVGVRGAVVADDAVPRVLLLGEQDTPDAAAIAVLERAPVAVLSWPRQRDRLHAVVGGILATPRPRAGGGSRLGVGGAAGGVGTSTVVVALAGLAAWRGLATLATVRGPSPASGLATVPFAALGAPDLWARTEPLPGVPTARALRLADDVHAVPDRPLDASIALAVLDHGVDLDVDVLVARPDRAGLDGLVRTTAAAVVLVGDGPAGAADVTAAAAGRRLIRLPVSARVARAGLLGRVPAGLPGTWLHRLSPLVATVPGAWT